MASQPPIGGEFSLPWRLLFQKKGRPSPPSPAVAVSTGRDALKYIINCLHLSSDDHVLLPSYLCSEVLTPFMSSGIPYTFYQVTDTLQCDIRDIRQKITPKTKMVLVIHYFGFPQPITKIKKMLPESTLLVEDCVHGFLSTVQNKPLGSLGDISFTSYRKYLPFPDGSRIEFRNGNYLVPGRAALIYPSLRTILLLLKGMVHHFPWPKLDSFFYHSFKYTERLLSSKQEPTGMSFLSRKLWSAIDLRQVAAVRRKNYAYLLAHLSNKKIQPLFPVLPLGVCPLGFPIICRERDQLKEHLVAQRIYPPIHWALPTQLDQQKFPHSYHLSQSLLTIPCDQRYAENDMQRIVEALNSW